MVRKRLTERSAKWAPVRKQKQHRSIFERAIVIIEAALAWPPQEKISQGLAHPIVGITPEYWCVADKLLELSSI